MKYSKIFILITFILPTLYSSCQNNEGSKNQESTLIKRENMVGVWIGLPGYFTLDKNGSFKFSIHENNNTKRIIDYSGKWELDDLSTIKLSISIETIIEGGDIVDVDLPGGGRQIIGGEKVIKNYDPLKIIKYQISDIMLDEKKPNPVSIIIDGVKYEKYGAEIKDIRIK